MATSCVFWANNSCQTRGDLPRNTFVPQFPKQWLQTNNCMFSTFLKPSLLDDSNFFIEPYISNKRTGTVCLEQTDLYPHIFLFVGSVSSKFFCIYCYAHVTLFKKQNLYLAYNLVPWFPNFLAMGPTKKKVSLYQPHKPLWL